MLLLANDPTSGDFGGPYSPSLSFSVGETPTGADGDTLSFSFNFKAASSTPDGSRIEIDLGTEGRDDRYNFMAIEHTATGLRLVQNTPQADGINWQNNSFNWETGNIQLGPDMDPNVEHTITVIFRAIDGSNNDIIEYYVDGVLVGTGSSFENFGEFHLAQPHSSAVREVTNILFRAGEPAGNGFPQDGPGGQRAGFYIDDLTMQAFDSRQLQFDPTNSAYDHLAAGQTENVTVNYNVVDGKGGVTPATAVITVTGINDTAVITGDDTGSATETNAVLTVTGDLDVADVDDGESVFVAQTNTDGTWGAFSIDTAGEWSYVTDNAQNQFSAGQTYVDSFTVASADGTTEVVTITITGTNDAAVITGTSTGSVVEAGGVLNGTPGTPQATGNLDHTDVDDNNADDVWQGRGRHRLERLWQLRRDLRGRVDLHAQQQPFVRAGAERRRHPDRHVHGRDRGRHHAERDRHDQRHQRRGGDHRHQQRRADRDQCPSRPPAISTPPMSTIPRCSMRRRLRAPTARSASSRTAPGPMQ